MVITSRRLLEDLDRQTPSTSVIPTGFSCLDELTGGFGSGQVWIVTATPGQGMTTLMIQWAAALACTHGWKTWLTCPREDTAMCASRLIACLGKVPLRHVLEHRLDADDWRRAEPVRDLIERVNLQIAPKGESFTMPSEAQVQPSPARSATVIDDADLVPSCTPEVVQALAQAGCLVLLSLPRHLMVESSDEDGDLDPAWARVADVVLEVRSRGLTRTGTDAWDWCGVADLTVLKHRRGPTTTATVAFQGFYARFVDVKEG